jgi:hypothetical protein
MHDKSKHLGTCHRCGWRTTVTRVPWRSRHLMNGAHSYSRLCGECANALTGEAPISIHDSVPRHWVADFLSDIRR